MEKNIVKVGGVKFEIVMEEDHNHVVKYHARVNEGLGKISLDWDTIEHIEGKIGNEIKYVYIGNRDSEIGDLSISNVETDVFVWCKSVHSVVTRDCNSVYVEVSGKVGNLDIDGEEIGLTIRTGSEVDNIQISGGGYEDNIRITESDVKKMVFRTKNGEYVEMNEAKRCSLEAKCKEDGIFLSVRGNTEAKRVEAKKLSTLSIKGKAYIESVIVDTCNEYRSSTTQRVDTMRVKGEINDFQGMFKCKPKVIFIDKDNKDRIERAQAEAGFSGSDIVKVMKYPGLEKAEQIERRRENIKETGTMVYLM